jgi:hypothetical protein
MESIFRIAALSACLSLPACAVVAAHKLNPFDVDRTSRISHSESGRSPALAVLTVTGILFCGARLLKRRGEIFDYYNR